MAGVDLINPAEPHLVPGYTGFSPQYRYRCGETYGSLTHKLLLDPTVNRAEKLIISDRTTDDYEVTRPPKDDIDVLNSRSESRDPIYTHPMIPGYEGFMPNMNARNGQRYTVLATEGLAEFERQQLQNKAACNRLQKLIAVQSGHYEPRNLEERLMPESQFKLPLLYVRPDRVGIMRNLALEEQYETPRSPYFMDNENPNKYFVSGYSGHVPYGHAQFGATNVPMTNSALCDFTTNYRKRQSTEWAPVTISRPDPPVLIQPTEIYHKHVGLIPNYLGHVPGSIFRYGKTYGADTTDAKRWLRGDFSV